MVTDDTTEVIDARPHATPGEDTTDQDSTKKWGEWETPSWLNKARRDLAATAWRLRRPLLPHVITGGIAAGGLAAHSITAPGTSPAAVAVLTAAAAFPAAGLSWMAVKRRRPRWARRVLLAGLTGAAWLTAAPFGVDAPQAAALLAAEYALAAGWWRANRIGYPNLTPAEQDTPDMTSADEILRDWEEFVACDGGPLPRSKLTNPTSTRHTISFDLELWRGRQSLSTALEKLDKIAGGVDRDVDEIIVEGLPKTLDSNRRRSTARVRFQVITDSPISGDVKFTGPRRRGGLLDMGPFADGSGDASWRHYTPGSMWSGVIIGGTGIGKSRLVENLAISALSGGDTIIIYVDPQGGVSSPALADHSHLFVPGANIDELLDALLAGIEARGEENAAEGWTGFTPSPQRPGILTIVEECHRPFAVKHQANRASYVAREGRKVGFAIWGISQYPGLVTFGNNEALRSSILEGNGVVLRSTSNQTKNLMPGLDVNPKTLPKIPGYAYVLGSGETGSRTAPFRNRDTGSDSTATGAWLAAQPSPPMDDLLTNAIARSAGAALFQGREEAAAARRDLSRARVEALRRGLDPDTVAPRPGRAEPAPVEQDDSVEGLGVVIKFPGPLTDEQLRPDPAETVPLELTGSHRAVLAAVGNGAIRPADVETAVGLSHRRVADLLRELVAAGYLTQPRYGRYERAA